jgi:hypothetical protein
VLPAEPYWYAVSPVARAPLRNYRSKASDLPGLALFNPTSQLISALLQFFDFVRCVIGGCVVWRGQVV